MSLSQGDHLGRYEILGPIGAGGMGEVWRARDTELDREVAVKVLPESFASDANRLERFQREAKALAALSHPNLLDIYDVGTTDGLHYAVTELLEGDTLRERITPSGLPWKKVTSIGAAVADGLAAAHGRGIIHRDLKPENLFLTADGRVKILDFGLASVHEEADSDAETATITEAGTVMGTPGYMAPEQVKGKPADTRSDIFSLGCVIYEMASGHRAFRGETGVEVIANILKEEPPQLSSSGASVPVDLERAVHRCLEKRPEARFQSAADLAYSLNSVGHSGSAPVMATPGSGIETTTGKKYSLPKIGAITALLILVAVTSWWTLTQRGGDQTPAEVASTLDPNRIAVVPFTNRTGDASLDNLAALTADRLTQGLAELDEIEVSPASVVSAASAGVEPAILVKEVAKGTDSGLVLTGVWDAVGTGLELQATLEDAEKGAVVHAFDPIMVNREVPQEAIATLRDWTLIAVQDHLHPALAFAAGDRFPKYEAYREYRTWFQTMGRGRWETALEIDPEFHRARIAPVFAHMVGGDPNARKMLEPLMEDPRLTVRQTHIVSGLDSMLEGDYQGCIEEFDWVRKQGHDSWVIRFSVLLCAHNANRLQLAADTFEHLGPPPFDLQGYQMFANPLGANAYHLLGRYEDELAMTLRWKEAAPTSYVVHVEARALAALGHFDELDDLVTEVFNTRKRSVWVGTRLLGLAEMLWGLGQRPKGIEMAERAAEWWSDTTIVNDADECDLCLAECLFWADRVEEALPIFRELAATERYAAVYLALSEARLGNRDSAEQVMDRAIKEFYEVEGARVWNKPLNRARLAAELGDRDGALHHLREAIALGYPRWIDLPWLLVELRDDPEFQEIMRPKG